MRWLALICRCVEFSLIKFSYIQFVWIYNKNRFIYNVNVRAVTSVGFRTKTRKQKSRGNAQENCIQKRFHCVRFVRCMCMGIRLFSFIHIKYRHTYHQSPIFPLVCAESLASDGNSWVRTERTHCSEKIKDHHYHRSKRTDF